MNVNGTPSEHMRAYLMNYDNLPYGMAVVKNDTAATIMEANSAFYKIIGHTKEQFMKNHGNSWIDILIDDVYDQVEKMIATERDGDVEWDLRVKTADTSVVWVRDIVHYDATLDLFFITLVDITEKMIATAGHLSYEAFQTRNEILGYLNLYTTEHITVTDAVTDEVVYINPAASNLLGFQHESDWFGKPYCEIAFGSKENVHPSYFEPLSEDKFTVGEYYNQFHKKYYLIKSKLITVPALDRKMRLNIITDVTSQKKLERKMEAQSVLHNCIETLFTAGATDRDPEKAYYNILNQMKTYYRADRAFFYKFKAETYEVENFIEVASTGLQKVASTLPMVATKKQIEGMQELTKEKLVSIESVLEHLDRPYKVHLAKAYQEYHVNTFSCTAINNEAGKIIAFMGITNPQTNEESKSLMELLSQFIRMFIEHEEDHEMKEEALKHEAISKRDLMEKCGRSFQGVEHPKENIQDVLDTLCRHYDADFAIIISRTEDSAFGVTYVGGRTLPDLSGIQQSSHFMGNWLGTFEKHSYFASDLDFDDVNAPMVKKMLKEKFGIYNFVASPMRDADGGLIGLLIVNNFNLTNRSHLMVHVVAKSASDYLAKISMSKKIQLEPATRLNNKVTTRNQIDGLLEDGKKGTLFIIDIDNFKNLNDTLGHQVGDKAVVDVAGALKKIFRSTDVIGRVGGDEFMVFSPDLMSDTMIAEKAKQLLDKCHLYYKKNDLTTDIGVSIGICSVDDGCNTFRTLYERADNALYMAKENGKNQYHIYTLADGGGAS